MTDNRIITITREEYNAVAGTGWVGQMRRAVEKKVGVPVEVIKQGSGPPFHITFRETSTRRQETWK